MRAVSNDISKQVIITHHVDVLCINLHSVLSLASCTQEEVETRMLFLLEDAACKGTEIKVLIRTVNTDVVILAITAAKCLTISKMCVDFEF